MRGMLPRADWEAVQKGLYPMYTHMIKQRRKMFGGSGRKLGAKPKTN